MSQLAGLTVPWQRLGVVKSQSWGREYRPDLLVCNRVRGKEGVPNVLFSALGDRANESRFARVLPAARCYPSGHNPRRACAITEPIFYPQLSRLIVILESRR